MKIIAAILLLVIDMHWKMTTTFITLITYRTFHDENDWNLVVFFLAWSVLYFALFSIIALFIISFFIVRRHWYTTSFRDLKTRKKKLRINLFYVWFRMSSKNWVMHDKSAHFSSYSWLQFNCWLRCDTLSAVRLAVPLGSEFDVGKANPSTIRKKQIVTWHVLHSWNLIRL